MSSRLVAPSDSSTASSNVPIVSGKAEIKQLCDLAARGLEPMFDPATKLFCQRYLRQDGGQDNGMVRQGVSYRYSIMSFLGLLEYERSGGKSPIPLRAAIENLVDQSAAAKSVDNIGDLGLLLWLCAKAAPERLPNVQRDFTIESALDRYEGAHEGNTMELSWFLTGLSYAAVSPGGSAGNWRQLAERTYASLRRNQGGFGFFGHSGTSGTLAAKLRGRIGSFADQVYPIYAYSKYGTAFESNTALNEAKNCAAAICKVQGSLGQWWWHYDSVTGRVVQRYPVYSVHQHAMAPMALIAVNQAAKCDFSEAMFKGLRWIYGANELNTPTLDSSLAVAWRAIQPQSKLRLRAAQATAYLRFPDESGSPGPLKMLYECWPYELGWLLYAFSNY